MGKTDSHKDKILKKLDEMPDSSEQIDWLVAQLVERTSELSGLDKKLQKVYDEQDEKSGAAGEKLSVLSEKAAALLERTGELKAREAALGAREKALNLAIEKKIPIGMTMANSDRLDEFEGELKQLTDDMYTGIDAIWRSQGPHKNKVEEIRKGPLSVAEFGRMSQKEMARLPGWAIEKEIKRAVES